MVNRKNINQLLGSLINIINSGLNFGIYIFLPILIGIHSYTNFQMANVTPSFLILLFSPNLPFVVHESKTAFLTFVLTFLLVIAILFPFSNKILLLANILWLSYGFMAMVLYYSDEKKKFYFYTIFLTVVQIGSLFFFRDYHNSYVLTSLSCFIILLLVERKSLLSYLKGYNMLFSWKIINSMLRPIFSISFFWQILLFIASHYGAAGFLSLTYYSKISLSTTVAIFTISALDILKEKKVNTQNFIFLLILSIISVNILIFILNYFGKQALNINNLVASSFLLFSVFPSLVFNIVSDAIFYRVIFGVTLVITVLLILLGINPTFSTIGAFAVITIASLFSYNKLKLALVKNEIDDITIATRSNNLN